MSRPQKINSLTTKISKTIEREEDKIRSIHRIGSLKVRTTGKIAQLIWKRVDFIEFDQQWLHQLDQNLTEKKIQLNLNVPPPISEDKSIYQRERGFYIVFINTLARKIKKN